MSWDRKAERKEKFEKKNKAKTKQFKKERIRNKEDTNDNRSDS
mgnify:CR=1 FL=1